MIEKFCTYCGTEFVSIGWPKFCKNCQQGTWKNPIPVVVTIIPIRNQNKVGILLVKRAIPPIGGIALPGGYIDSHESWQDAARRELIEETGIEILKEDFLFCSLESSTYNDRLLIFASGPEQDISVLDGFKPNSEVSELMVTYEACELCFPLQTEALALWFFTGNGI